MYVQNRASETNRTRGTGCGCELEVCSFIFHVASARRQRSNSCGLRVKCRNYAEARSVCCAVPSSWKRPGLPFPTVVLAASPWGVIVRERKRCWLWKIDRGRTLRRIVLRPIASHMLRRRRERPWSSTWPRPRP